MRKEWAFRLEFPDIPRKKTGGSAEEVVDLLFLPNRGAFQAVADEKSKTTAKRAASYCVLTDPG